MGKQITKKSFSKRERKRGCKPLNPFLGSLTSNIENFLSYFDFDAKVMLGVPSSVLNIVGPLGVLGDCKYSRTI